MPKPIKRPRLELSTRERQALERLIDEGNNQHNQVKKAKVLLLYHQDTPITHIQDRVNLSRPTIYKYIDRALNEGIDTALAPRVNKRTLEGRTSLLRYLRRRK